MVSIKINSTNPRAIVTIGTSWINSLVVTTIRYTYSFALDSRHVRHVLYSNRTVCVRVGGEHCWCTYTQLKPILLSVCSLVWMCVFTRHSGVWMYAPSIQWCARSVSDETRLLIRFEKRMSLDQTWETHSRAAGVHVWWDGWLVCTVGRWVTFHTAYSFEQIQHRPLCF